MKNTTQPHIFIFIALVCFAFLTQGCLEDKCTGEYTYIQYNPIYKSVEDIRNEVGLEASRDLCNPGKMFLYGSYIYVNDIRKGIHIIDNSNPSAPTPIAFLNIPGNVDIAVKDNILYADNYTDLEIFDISSPTNPVHKGRVEDVFEGSSSNHDGNQIVGYDEEEVTVEYDCDNYNNGRAYPETIFDFDDYIPSGGFINNSTTSFNPTGSTAPAAVAGSLSRFANYGNYLYMIDDRTDLDVFDITDACNPVSISEIEIGWGIETLFPSGENLFVGADDGLYIYSLENPSFPSFRSKFDHARACDPVYVQGNTAYVTLRSGNSCQGFNNQLDILDVTDISNPDLLISVGMSNPHGLSIYEDLLMICEGEFGFKIFDKSEYNNIAENELSHVDNINAYDVIAIPGSTIAMVIGEDGLFQYDFSTASDPIKLSLISATRECAY